jgi:hypothetical protein
MPEYTVSERMDDESELKPLWNKELCDLCVSAVSHPV